MASTSQATSLIMEPNMSQLLFLPSPQGPTTVGLVAVVLESLLMLLILFGNSLIFAVFFRSEHLRTITNYYILQLAIADFSVGLLMPVHVAMYLHPQMLQVLHVCLFRYTSMLLFQSASISSLLALTCDRFTAVMWPLHYHEVLTKRQYVRSVIVVWFFPITLGFVLPMVWHNKWSEVPERECDFMFVLKTEYIGYCMIPAFVVCTVVLITMYVKIFHIAERHSASIAQTTEPVLGSKPSERRRLRRDMKMVRTGLIVLGGFYLCWLPFIIMSGIQAYTGAINNPTLKYARNMALFPAIFNSALNPIIYSFRLSTFKVEFAKILRLNIQARQNSSLESDSDQNSPSQKNTTKELI